MFSAKLILHFNTGFVDFGRILSSILWILVAFYYRLCRIWLHFRSSELPEYLGSPWKAKSELPKKLGFAVKAKSELPKKLGLAVKATSELPKKLTVPGRGGGRGLQRVYSVLGEGGSRPRTMDWCGSGQVTPIVCQMTNAKSMILPHTRTE